jgi:hypothetical protein
MPDRAAGPVKPPVIDLTARTQRAEEDAKTTAPRTPPFTWSTKDANWPLLGATALGGAILGTVLTYVVATGLPLPTRPQAIPPDPTPQLTAQASRLDTLQSELASLKASTTKTQVSLDATIQQLDSGLKDANQAISDIKAAIPPAAAPVDLTPLQNQLNTLKSEVDAIAAGAPGTDASTIGQNLQTLQTDVGSLTTRLNGIDSTLTALRADLDTTRKTLSDHINSALPNEVGPALKLPLILSGLESAFANGRPFDPELKALGTVLPGAAVPADLASIASAGISRPDVLMQNFESTLPAILAARAPAGGGDWVETATDWVKAMLALRPAEEQAGDSPDAVVSRLEGAMGRRDYAAAAALIGKLPGPMQTAAAPVAHDIGLHAEADALLADLRARALSTAETAK